MSTDNACNLGITQQPQQISAPTECDYLQMKNDAKFQGLLHKINDCWPKPEKVVFSDAILKVCNSYD